MEEQKQRIVNTYRIIGKYKRFYFFILQDVLLQSYSILMSVLG